MSSLKTVIEISDVEKFLTKKFGSDINNVEFLKGGEISQAFSFDDSSDSYIIKIRKVRKRDLKIDPFQKEIIAYNYIKKKDSTIPIPKITEIGDYKEIKKRKYIYCIAEKKPGDFVHLFPKEKFDLVDEYLIETLNKIHSVDISKTKGYGKWKKFTSAELNSMQEHILDVIERQKVYTNERFSSGIFEKDLYIQGSEKIKQLIKYCSEKRSLVHADYGYDNVLADADGNITAVYDWEHSIFGDFVYDIAWIDFWEFRAEGTYARLYYDKYKDSKDLDFDDYAERLLCYKIYIGMTAAGFFSESNQEDKYLSAKQKILNLLLF